MKLKTLTSILILIAIIYPVISTSASDGKNISLSQLYSKEELGEILIRLNQWSPFPKASERDKWASIPENISRAFINLGNEYLDKPVPSLPATLYLEYQRIGNRSNYQNIWYERRKMLHCLVLAECMEGKKRFLDSIANVIWAICEESSWTWPAHVGAQKAGVSLPDTTEPVVALFSAQTANSLAWTDYLLKRELDTVSPQLCKRIERQIDSQILTPYLQRNDFGWMGFNARADGRGPNNWNPWINSNVLTAALLMEKDQDRRAELVHKVLRCLDNFLAPYPSDGSCDEGPSYWGHAGASLFDNLELLYSATNGRFDVYDKSMIKEIGRFIYRVHIAEDFFVNIGDCDGRFAIYRDLVFRYGKRINDPGMQTLAVYNSTEEELLGTNKAARSLGRMLYSIFNASELLAAKKSLPPLLGDVWLGNEDMQMMAARDKGGSLQGLYVASWAGHNGQSHNHNDVGNFIVYANGRPFIIDIGKPEYTRQTFSSRRYELRAMQSAYHNLPTINGVMQKEGRQYAAKGVAYESAEGFAQLKMNIAPAYPDEAGINSWLRTVRLNRGKDLQIVDSFDLKEQSQDIVQSLMTPCEIIRDEPGQLALRDPEEQLEMVIRYDPQKLSLESETINLNDERISSVWGSRLYRIVLRPKTTTTKDTWTLRFNIVPTNTTTQLR
ncbi:MAG: heparinase II/III family protein [Sedimentisphaerales bacterium]